jgi:methionyl-tRNA synthetase
MLMAAGIEPPKTVFAHGWWTTNGKKMSKSLHNFVDPLEVINKYSVDALRYFLVREMPLGADGDFSEDKLAARINGELVADLGNLIYRVLTLAEKFDGKITGTAELDKNLDIKKIDDCMIALDPYGALDGIWSFIRSANKYVNDNKVWTLEGERMSNALYNLLEACRVISILISPFLPETSKRINEQLETEPGNLTDCKFREFEGKPKKGEILFKKVDLKR